MLTIIGLLAYEQNNYTVILKYDIQKWVYKFLKIKITNSINNIGLEIRFARVSVLRAIMLNLIWTKYII